MMKSVGIVLLLALLVSCGSSQKKGSDGGELEGIKNENFKMPPAKSYQSVDDFLDGSVAPSEDVLKQESLAKTPVENIEEPSDVEDALKKSLVACYRGQFDLAEKLFDSMYREYRKNPIYWTQVGTCYFLKGSKRKALLFYNKAKEIKGNYAPPVNNIGVIFEKNGFDQKAMKAYEEAKNLSSFSLTPLFNLAQLYTKYGFIEEGTQLFRSMVNLNKDDDDALYGYGFLEMMSGDYQKAVQAFGNMSRNYYRKPEVGVNVAYALALSGNKSKARDVLEDLNETTDSDLLSYIAQIKKVAE